MIDIDSFEYNPLSEEIVNFLQEKTGSTDPTFFRVHVAYYFAKIASMMRCNIKYHNRVVPVNVYAINLAPSGFGKGYSTSIMDKEITGKFMKIFREEFFPEMAQRKLAEMAQEKTIDDDSFTEEAWLEKLQKDFKRSGPLVTEFDSATVPAMKQLREKLLVAQLASINLEMDEIGSNLLGNTEALTACLELFDGIIKQKLVKNTSDNERAEGIDGLTPTNICLFGTPSKLLNGSNTEEEFFSMIEAGYGRRCLFGYVPKADSIVELSAEEIYDRIHNPDTLQKVSDIADQLASLVDDMYCNITLEITKDVAIESIRYQNQCKEMANNLKANEEIRKAEITHRYFKAIKLAGAYAFIDGAEEVEMEHLHQAIKLVEDSGAAFQKMLTREKNYVRLAKYIVDAGTEVSHVDLDTDLHYYPKGTGARKEMMNDAISWAYGNNITIRRIFRDSVERFKGEALKETDLSEVILSYVDDSSGVEHPVEDFQNEKVNFDELHTLTQESGYHWVNHHLKGGYRNEANIIPEFNLVVLDIDNDPETVTSPVSVDTAKLLMRDYAYMLYTTKSHQKTSEKNPKGSDRFRLILPISHHLKMEKEVYAQFIKNIIEWLPFEVDRSTTDRCRKWETFDGEYHYNEGNLLSAFDFIPDTSRCEKMKNHIEDLHNFDALERWFIDNTGSGNRNNQLLKFALMLTERGEDPDNVKNSVMALNDKLQSPLDPTEIYATIMSSVYRKHAELEHNH